MSLGRKSAWSHAVRRNLLTEKSEKHNGKSAMMSLGRKGAWPHAVWRNLHRVNKGSTKHNGKRAYKTLPPKTVVLRPHEISKTILVSIFFSLIIEEFIMSIVLFFVQNS